MKDGPLAVIDQIRVLCFCSKDTTLPYTYPDDDTRLSLSYLC